MLNINLKGTGIELTPAIREYAETKTRDLEKLIPKDDTSAIADVELAKTTGHHKSGNIFRAEINLHIAGKQLYADATTEDLYTAIDDVRDAMLNELRKEKGKHAAQRKKDGGFFKNLLRGFK